MYIFNFKRLRAIAGLIYFITVVLAIIYLIIGCSTPKVIEKPVEITIPVLKDSIVLRDSVILRDSVLVDSLWFGEVRDSLGQVVGDLKVHFKKKIAELKLNEKRDTINVKIPVHRNDKSDHLLNLVNTGFEWWEKIILYGGLGLILSGIIYLRIKRGKL